MAREIRAVATSGTLYAVLMNPAGQVWNGSSFETYASVNYSSYVISLTEQGNSGLYVADFPTAITANGVYEYFVYRQPGVSPAEGDTLNSTGRVSWVGTTGGVGSDNEIRGVSPSGTVYARIMNPAGYLWNGSTFEAYNASNYSTYVVTMTESGNSGFYTADFPSGITASATYDFFIHRQSGGSPAEGDVIINTGSIDWTGTSSASATTGSMTGSDWRDYVLRLGFKRTDKDTELYEATTDAIEEMRRRFMFDEAEADTVTADTITTDGDFRLDLESDFGLVLGVILQDGITATRLKQLSKNDFDKNYSDVFVTVDRGYPKHFCIYAGQIYIGPVPDKTTYTYRISYSRRAGTVTSGTTAVPFTKAYRDVLAENVLMRLYAVMEDFDKADRHEAKFEKGFLLATRKEIINSGEHCFEMKARDC